MYVDGDDPLGWVFVCGSKEDAIFHAKRIGDDYIIIGGKDNKAKYEGKVPCVIQKQDYYYSGA